GHIRSFPQCHSFSKLEFIIRVVVDHRNSQSAEAQIHWSLMLVGSLHRGFRLHVVGWIDDYHSRDGPHKSDVLVALMGGTVLTHRDTRVGSSDLYVQFGIADGVADLLKGAACRKHGKGAGKGDLACGGDPSRHAHHIGLSDTAVN